MPPNGFNFDVIFMLFFELNNARLRTHKYIQVLFQRSKQDTDKKIAYYSLSNATKC